MNHCFKGFSFFSEPKEEIEVQRQIKEYLRLKTLYKKKYQENEQRKQESKNKNMMMVESMQRKMEESKIEEKRELMQIRSLQTANQNIEVLLSQRNEKGLKVKDSSRSL